MNDINKKSTIINKIKEMNQDILGLFVEKLTDFMNYYWTFKVL